MMNKTEVDLFRYCCKQANYDKSNLSISEYKWFDKNSKQDKSKIIRFVTIHFQKHILDLCKDFAEKKNLDRKYVVGIANRWLRDRNPISKGYDYEDIKDKYFFSFTDSTYYDILPLRVYRKLNRLNPQEIAEVEPSYDYFKPHLNDLEKKYLRFLIRNCTKKKSYYDGAKFWIKIDDYHKLYLNWVGRTHHTICSKNATRKFIRRWTNLNIYSKQQEKALHKKGGINYFSVIELDENNPKHDKYIRSMPKNIYMELKRKFEEENQ